MIRFDLMKLDIFEKDPILGKEAKSANFKNKILTRKKYLNLGPIKKSKYYI